MALINRYTGLDQGALYITGNTLGLSGNLSTITPLPAAPAVGQPGPWPVGTIGTFTTVQNLQATGGWPVGTTNDYLQNSSAAQFNLPAGSTILYSELIWSGVITTANFDFSANIGDPINFTTPQGTFQVTPDGATTSTLISGGTGNTAYVTSQNVTSLVQAGGNGTYIAGAVPGALGNSVNFNDPVQPFSPQNYLGWTLITAYRNLSLPARYFYIWVNDTFVNTSTSEDILVTNFITPAAGSVGGRLLLASGEGDSGAIGDQALFGPDIANLTVLGNPVSSPNPNPGTSPNNPNNNFFSSQINGNDGLLDQSGTFGTSNHNAFEATYIPAGRQGWDITSVDVGNTLLNSQTEAVIRLDTQGDAYINALVALQLDAPYVDISVNKTLVSSSVVAGERVTFSIVVTNNGPYDAEDVEVIDIVPANFSGAEFSIDGGATWSQWNSSYTIGTLLNGASRTILLRGDIASDATGTLENTASVTTSTFENNLSNNTSTLSQGIQTLADVSIVKSDAPDPVTAGEELVYTLSVANAGPSDAQNVTVSDTLPLELSNGEYSLDGGVTWNLWTGSLNIDLLQSGAAVTVLLRGTVASSTISPITNTASASSTTADPDTGNNTSTVSTLVTSLADLTIVKTDSPDPVQNGQMLTYVVQVTGQGPSDAQNVQLSDNLPSALVNGEYSTDNGITWSAWNGNLNLGTLAAGSSTQVWLRGTVNDSATGTITNTAAVSTTTPESDPDNNTASASTQILSLADLSIIKQAGVATVTSGELLEFTLTINNAGPADAQNTVITDTIPPELINPEYSINGGITWLNWTGSYNLGTLQNGDSFTLNIRGEVSSAALGTIVNTASVDSTTQDPNIGNNTSIDSVDVLTSADLMILKTASFNPIRAGETQIYTLTITNAGPSDAQNVEVTDILPAELSNGEYSLDGGISWNFWSGNVSLGTLASGASFEVLIRGEVGSDTVAAFSNTAQVSSTTPDPDTSNNTSSILTDVLVVADLEIFKQDNPDPVVPGNQLQYTITAVNNGPSDATGVILTDILPSELTGAEYSSDNGATWQSFSGTYTIGDLASGQSVDLLLRADVSEGTVSVISNTAQISAVTVDDNPDNNTVVETTDVNPLADLEIIKTAQPDPVVAGEEIIYTVTFTNLGPSDAQNVVLTDNISSAISNPEFSADNGVTWNAWMSPLNVGTLTAGTTRVGLIRGTVMAGAQGNITNVVIISSDTTDPIPDNNTDVVSTSISEIADLMLTKSLDTVPVIAGQQVRYTMTIDNLGPSEADNVILTDVLSGNIENPEYTLDGGISWNPWNGSVNLGSLMPGTQLLVGIRGNLNETATGTLDNTASVASDTPDPDPVNNTDTSTANIEVRGELSITKQSDRVTAVAGEQVEYTIEVSNNGPSSLVNVVMTDIIPTELTAVEYSQDNGATWNAFGGSIILGTIASMTSVTILLRGNVVPDSQGVLINVAEAVTESPIDEPQVSTTLQLPIVQQADLSIVKTAAPEPIVAGQQLIYTIVINNAGPSMAEAVELIDTLPLFIENREYSLDNGLNYLPYQSPVAIGNMNPSSSMTILIRGDLRTSALGSLTNTAQVDSLTPDPDITNNTDTVVSTIESIADMGIIKSVSAPQITAGEMVTYTLEIENFGPSDAFDVVLSDVLPQEIMNAELSTDNGISWMSYMSLYTIGTVTAGASLTLLIRGILEADILPQTIISNTAQISTSSIDPNPANDSSTVVFETVSAADLAIVKTVQDAIAVPGSSITYELTVTNNGPSMAVAAVLDDTIPAQLNNAEISEDGGITWQPYSNPYPLGNIQPNEIIERMIRAEVTQVSGGSIINTARISSDSDDPDLSNNTSSVSIDVEPQADLAVIKALDTLPVVAGEELIYRLTVTNNGPSIAWGSTLSDTLPIGLEDGAYSQDNGISWNVWNGTLSLGDLLPQETVVILLRANVQEQLTGQILNTAVAASNSVDTNPSNNTSQLQTIIQALADVAVVKTAQTADFTAGTEGIYEILVMNNGPSVAENVELFDVPDADFLNAAYSLDNGQSWLPWTESYFIGNMQNGESITLWLRGLIAPDAQSQIPNMAQAYGTTLDTDPDNNTSMIVTPVLKSADISIIKTVSPQIAVPGTQLTYTLTVTNNGPSIAEDVVLTDVVPNVITDPVYSLGGAFLQWNGSLPLGTLNVGQSTVVLIRGTVIEDQLQPIENTAEVYGSTPDPDLSNNISSVINPVDPLSDLSIVKEVLNDPVIAGNMIDYRITVRNAGPSSAENTELTDNIPFVIENPEFSIDDGNSYQPWSSPYALGTVAAGEIITLLIRGQVSQSAEGRIVNTALVVSTTPDTNPDNNTSVTDTAIMTEGDIAITKTGTPNPVTAGEMIEYTLSAVNNGPSVSKDVVITDEISNQLIDVEYSLDQVTWQAFDGTYSINELAVGESIVLFIRARVRQETLLPIYNRAYISAQTSDSNPDNNEDDITTQVSTLADISVTKVVLTDPVVAGSRIEYDILISNNGPSAARDVSVEDIVSGIILNPEYSIDGGNTYAPWTGSYLFTMIRVDETILLKLRGDVAPQALGELSNAVQVTSITPDPDPDNNQDTVVSQITTEADLSIAKTSSTQVIAAEEILEYELLVINNGPSTALNVVITDNLPAGLNDAVYSLDAGATYQPWNGSINIGSMDVMENRQIILQSRYSPSAPLPSELINTAEVTSQTADPNPDNNVSSIQTVVRPFEPTQCPIAVNAIIDVTQSLTGTVTAENPYDYPIVYSIVQEPINGTAELDPVTGSYSYTPLPGYIGSDQFTIEALTPQTGLSCTTEINVEVIDLAMSIVKEHTPSIAETGSSILYEVRVQNIAPVVIESAVLRDFIPIYTTVVPDSILIGGTVYSQEELEAGIEIGPMAANEEKVLTFEVIIDEGTPIDTIINNEAAINFSSLINGEQVAKEAASNEVATRVINMELLLTKAVDKAQTVAGGTLVYTLNAQNTGSTQLDSAIVSDELPPQITLVPGTVTVDNSPVPDEELASGIELAPLAVGETKVIRYEAVVEDTLSQETDIINVAQAVYSFTEGTDTLSQQTESNEAITTIEAAQIILTKTADRVGGVVGDTIWYELEISNTGSLSADETVITDPLSPYLAATGEVFLDNVSIGGDITQGILIGTVDSGETKTLRFSAEIMLMPPEGEIPNISSADYKYSIDGQPPILERETESNEEIVRVYAPELRITKVASTFNVEVGDEFFYELRVTNIGDIKTEQTVLEDELPAQFKVLEILRDGVPIADTLPVIQIGDLEPQEETLLTVRIEVTGLLMDGILYNNEASVQGIAIPDPNFPPETVSAQTEDKQGVRVVKVNVTIEKASDVQEAAVGDKVNYQLHVINDGDIEVINILVTDPLPDNISFVSGTVTVDGILRPQDDITTGVLLQQLAPGQTVVIAFDIIITEKASGSAVNRAQGGYEYILNFGEPPRSGSAQSNENEVFIYEPLLTIRKTADKKIVDLGDTYRYTVELRNEGDTLIGQATVYDTLPEQVSFVPGSVTIEGVADTMADPTVGILVGEIAQGAAITVSYLVEVIHGSTDGVIINEAYADYEYVLPNGAVGQSETEKVCAAVEITMTNFSQVTLDVIKCIPCCKPSIGAIEGISCETQVEDAYMINTPYGVSKEGQKLTGRKIIIHGTANVYLEYTALKDCTSLYSARIPVPLSGFIVVAPSYELMDIQDVDIICEKIYAEVDTPRSIQIHLTVLFKAQ